jgi:hypothetical protein
VIDMGVRWKRYVVKYCWDGQSLGNGRDHTWDVIDRETGWTVRNTNTRQEARDAAHELESQHVLARLTAA